MLDINTIVHMSASAHMHQEYMLVLQGAHVECEGLSTKECDMQIAHRLDRCMLCQLTT